MTNSPFHGVVPKAEEINFWVGLGPLTLLNKVKEDLPDLDPSMQEIMAAAFQYYLDDLQQGWIEPDYFDYVFSECVKVLLRPSDAISMLGAIAASTNHLWDKVVKNRMDIL